MVTSSLDYHNVCQHGVILENYPNFGLQCQIIGRLWRLGQSEKVYWKILQTQGTYDPWIETPGPETKCLPAWNKASRTASPIVSWFWKSLQSYSARAQNSSIGFKFGADKNTRAVLTTGNDSEYPAEDHFNGLNGSSISIFMPKDQQKPHVMQSLSSRPLISVAHELPRAWVPPRYGFRIA
ncbi:hypothetical protein CKAH01_13301 [Colletotrichum kahawae]|uniref:Uncharacterized protein n=1 Tax=Colletotrichum kahawae TaxID=34407 RepID=A0AAE0DB97_COLKA|nr:hypothetical protein CKAH01_13301 [Colletotrichum kahawae]